MNNNRANIERTHLAAFLRWFKPVFLLLISIMGAPIVQASPSSIAFGVQPWPGLKIKTKVITELLETIGYKTNTVGLSTPLIMRSLSRGDLDVSLGGWYPGAAYQIDPLVKKGKVIELATNIPNALSGLAVPSYVHNAGVTTMRDLVEHADKFDHSIYGIEPGSSFNVTVQEMIKSDRFNLGDWQLKSSSTAVMLAEVGRKIKKHEWIVFYGWKPHWMNKVYNLYYIKSDKKSLVVDQKSVVYTLVRKKFSEEHPNVARLLKQFRVESAVQSTWIYNYSYKKDSGSADTVARSWISSHLDVVHRWLTGVKTAQGKPAFPVVKSVF